MALDLYPHISRFEFYHRALANSDVNFVASVVTPWHVLCLDAAIRYMEAKGTKMCGMVLIEPHVCSGFNVDERCFLGGHYEIYVVDDTPKNASAQPAKPVVQPSLWKQFLNRNRIHRERLNYVLFGGINWRNKREIYVFDYIYPDCKTGRYFARNGVFARHIIMDDGFISYFPNIWEKKPTQSLLRDVHGWMQYFRDVIWEHRLIFKFHHIISAFVFRKTKHALKVNEDVLPFFRLVFAEHATSDARLKGLDLHDAVVLATGTHLEEIDRYKNEDLRIWEAICKMLHEKGVKIYLKPHPRDTFFRDCAEKWGCVLFDDIDRMSIEGMCYIGKPKCVLGFPSMAIITPKIFCDVPTIGVFDLIDKGKCNDYAMNIMGNFERLFAEYVKFPTTMDELSNEIDKYIGKE